MTSGARSEQEARRAARELRLLIHTANAPIVGRASHSTPAAP